MLHSVYRRLLACLLQGRSPFTVHRSQPGPRGRLPLSPQCQFMAGEWFRSSNAVVLAKCLEPCQSGGEGAVSGSEGEEEGAGAGEEKTKQQGCSCSCIHRLPQSGDGSAEMRPDRKPRRQRSWRCGRAAADADPDRSRGICGWRHSTPVGR